METEKDSPGVAGAIDTEKRLVAAEEKIKKLEEDYEEMERERVKE